MVATSGPGQDALTALNIPCVQVGQTTLTQAAGTEVNKLPNVFMNNVTFFATSTGSAPRIWATNSVGETGVKKACALFFFLLKRDRTYIKLLTRYWGKVKIDTELMRS